jgi:hypothetical protein
MKRLIVAAILAACTMINPATAGSNECEGKITIGETWTTIAGWKNDGTGDYENGCRFKTDSVIGRRVLRKCPNGSRCRLSFPLGLDSEAVTKLDYVEKR